MEFTYYQGLRQKEVKRDSDISFNESSKRILWAEKFIPLLEDKLTQNNYSVSSIKIVGSAEGWASIKSSDVDLLVRINEGKGLTNEQKVGLVYINSYHMLLQIYKEKALPNYPVDLFFEFEDGSGKVSETWHDESEDEGLF